MEAAQVMGKSAKQYFKIFQMLMSIGALVVTLTKFLRGFINWSKRLD